MEQMLKAVHQTVSICNGSALTSSANGISLDQGFSSAWVSLFILIHPFGNWCCLLHAVIASGWLSVSSMQNKAVAPCKP